MMITKDWKLNEHKRVPSASKEEVMTQADAIRKLAALVAALASGLFEDGVQDQAEEIEDTIHFDDEPLKKALAATAAKEITREVTSPAGKDRVYCSKLDCGSLVSCVLNAHPHRCVTATSPSDAVEEALRPFATLATKMIHVAAKRGWDVGADFCVDVKVLGLTHRLRFKDFENALAVFDVAKGKGVSRA